MMRERRLADGKRLLQAACAAFARMQKGENGDAILVAHRLENTRGHLVGFLHDPILDPYRLIICIIRIKQIDVNEIMTIKTNFVLF